jgi:hypothetical protein
VSDRTPLTGRTRRLLAVSALAPALLFGVVTAAMGVALRDVQNALIGAGAAAVLAAAGAGAAWVGRDKPDQWWGVPTHGLFAALVFAMMAAGSAGPGALGMSENAYLAVAAVVTAALALLAWVPAHRATRLVLPGLGPAVVASPLVVTFTGRGKDADRLSVTPATLELAVRPDSVLKATRHSFPLGEVTGATAHTEAERGEHPVPGGGGAVVRTPPGDVLVVEVAGGRLVVAVKDPRVAADFILARARRWAVITGS